MYPVFVTYQVCVGVCVLLARPENLKMFEVYILLMVQNSGKLDIISLRIQTSHDRIGFFGFQSHPKMIGMFGQSFS